jgi:predicted helicase
LAKITENAILAHGDLYRIVSGFRWCAPLKKRLPRVPLAKGFRKLVHAGKELAQLHAYYEDQPAYPLTKIENKEPLNWRVERISLASDRSSIVYNDFLTLGNVPPETFEYKIGNRSALHWVIDQYQTTKNEIGTLIEDPNNIDDEEYIVRLIEKVVYVSVQSVRITKSLAPLKLPEN